MQTQETMKLHSVLEEIKAELYCSSIKCKCLERRGITSEKSSRPDYESLYPLYFSILYSTWAKVIIRNLSYKSVSIYILYVYTVNTVCGFEMYKSLAKRKWRNSYWAIWQTTQKSSHFKYLICIKFNMYFSTHNSTPKRLKLIPRGKNWEESENQYGTWVMTSTNRKRYGSELPVSLS